MNSKWLKMLLAASLALNVAFVVPYVYHKAVRKEPPPVRSLETLKSGLDLNSDQKEQLDGIIHQFKVKLMRLKQEMQDKRIDIIDQLGDPEFDPETITASTEAINKLEGELNHLFTDTLIRITAQLDSEQRLKFLYRLSKSWFFMHKKRPARPGRGGNPHESK